MKTTKKRMFGVLAGLFLVVVTTGVWAAQPVDVSGTTWDVAGKARMVVQRMGSERADTTLQVMFGPNETVGLAENEWSLTDEENDGFGGTYQMDNHGRPALSVDDDELSAYLSTGLINALEEDYPDIQILNVDLFKDSVTARVTSNKKGDTLNFKVSVKAKIDLMADGQSARVVMMLMFNGKELHVAELPSEQPTGSAWQMVTTSAFKAVGLPRMTDTSYFKMILGPNTDWQLGNNDFLVIADDDGEDVYIYGTYTQQKNKITFNGLEDIFEQSIIDYATDALNSQDDISSFSDVAVEDVQKYSVTGIIKPGKFLRINVSIRCIGSAIVDGEYGTARCTYTERGIGAPTDAGTPETPGE